MVAMGQQIGGDIGGQRERTLVVWQEFFRFIWPVGAEAHTFGSPYRVVPSVPNHIHIRATGPSFKATVIPFECADT